MKGIICREMYPIPDYRVSSDEDLLVKREEFPELEETLLDCGFVKEREEEAGMGTPRDPDTDGEMEGTEQSLDELHEVTFLHSRALRRGFGWRCISLCFRSLLSPTAGSTGNLRMCLNGVRSGKSGRFRCIRWERRSICCIFCCTD